MIVETSSRESIYECTKFCKDSTFYVAHTFTQPGSDQRVRVRIFCLRQRHWTQTAREKSQNLQTNTKPMNPPVAEKKRSVKSGKQQGLISVNLLWPSPWALQLFRNLQCQYQARCRWLLVVLFYLINDNWERGPRAREARPGERPRPGQLTRDKEEKWQQQVRSSQAQHHERGRVTVGPAQQPDLCIYFVNTSRKTFLVT